MVLKRRSTATPAVNLAISFNDDSAVDGHRVCKRRLAAGLMTKDGSPTDDVVALMSTIFC